MIFLSHNHHDKQIVEQFAIPLLEALGQDQVFYDSWSIQPGDGIIERMNSGLSDATLFLFFVSKNSLASRMVEMEWQNALIAKAKGQLRFIPIRIDQAPIPAILQQTSFLDLFNNGLDVTRRQVLDIAKGNNIFQPIVSGFSNIVGTYTIAGEDLTITMNAVHFLEPACEFGFVTTSPLDDFFCRVVGAPSFIQTPFERINTPDGIANMMAIKSGSPLVPGFPFRVCVTPKKGKQVMIDKVLHRESENYWKPILLTEG